MTLDAVEKMSTTHNSQRQRKIVRIKVSNKESRERTSREGKRERAQRESR